MAMAPANRPLGGLTVGAGGQMMTPEQVKIQREMAKSLMEQGRDASPVGHWSGALARALAGFAGGYQSRKANETESAGVSEAMALANGAMGGGSVGGTASPVASALAGHSPTDGHDHSNMTAADWLTYSNQGATRNQPIAASLVEAMSFLPDLGITMDVYSGGQDAEGPNRVGSTRHDHGNAADVTFRDASGRMLDWNNPNDIPVLQQIVSTARANGVTGFGAGDDYMGAGRMHIGFGNPGVWGAGGSGDTAPDWLRQAFEGVQSAPAGAGVSAGPAAGNVSQIAAALAHPFLPESTRAVLQAQLGQQMQMQNAAYEAQLQNQDPLRQLQIQQAQLALQAAQNPAAPAPIEINGQLVDPLTYEVIGDYRTPEPIKYQTVTLPDGSQALFQQDPATGQLVPADVAGGGTLGTGGRAGLTEAQAKTTLFSNMQAETNPVLSQIEQRYNPANSGDAIARATPIAGNFFQTEEGQIYQAAATAWAEGALRITTGAAATDPEIQRNLRVYFAQPGDTPATVAFKAQMRAMFERSIQASLGKDISGQGTLMLPEDFAAQAVANAPPEVAAQIMGDVSGASAPTNAPIDDQKAQRISNITVNNLAVLSALERAQMLEGIALSDLPLDVLDFLIEEGGLP